MAQLTALTANLNRDPKKQRKPFAAIDFCFFHDVEANRPQARAAAAYMRLVVDKQLPPWALFCFSDFKHAEASKRPLEEVAIIGEQWLLLAPEPLEGGYQGLFIAEHVVSGKALLGAYRGQQVLLQLPTFEDYVLAREGVELDEITRPVGAALSG